MSRRHETEYVPTLAAVIMALLVILAALLSGCGGSGGSGQGDKPVGNGTTVQKTAQITVHRAGGDTTIDFTKEQP